MFAGPYRDMVGAVLREVSLTPLFWVIGLGGTVLVPFMMRYSAVGTSLESLHMIMKNKRGMIRKLSELFNCHKKKAIVSSILAWTVAILVATLNLIPL